MAKNNARDQIPAPVVSPPASEQLAQARLGGASNQELANLQAQALGGPSDLAQQLAAAGMRSVDTGKMFSPPEIGPAAARELAMAAAELCNGNMLPSTLAQARRYLRLALVHLDGG